jgi:hypothetical protein
MDDVRFFPGVSEIHPEPVLEPLELDPAIVDVLMRAIDLASELKRRVDLPLDLAFDAAELARKSDEILN